MQENDTFLSWVLTDDIGSGKHAIYANWNPQEQSFEAWSQYRHSEQERKDRKRYIEALLNRTTWKLLEGPQYYKLLLSFHRRLERKPPNGVIRKWYGEYSRKESERIVNIIFEKRTYENVGRPPSTSIYFERAKRDLY